MDCGRGGRVAVFVDVGQNTIISDFFCSTMGRRTNGQPRGRKSDFTGEKKVWLDSFHDQIRDASNDPGSVYSDATMAFIRRYGYDLPFSENVDGDPAENPPDIPANPDAEEKKRRDGIQKQLRMVSFSV
jgi:hypothetical protein